MHVFFDPEGRPFLLGSEMRWDLEPNSFPGNAVRCQWQDHLTANVAELCLSVARLAAVLRPDWRCLAARHRSQHRSGISSHRKRARRPNGPSSGARSSQADSDFPVLSLRPETRLIDTLPFEIEAARLPYRGFGDLHNPIAVPAAGISLRHTKLRDDVQIPHGTSCGDFHLSLAFGSMSD